YQPRQPRIVAPPSSFTSEARFTFASSINFTDEERDNPWLLLDKEQDDGAVPVIADANSMTYVLHKQLGDDILYERGSEEPLRLRLVAALYDSVLQGELMMSEANFRRLFPEQEGYQLLLVETPPAQAGAVAAAIEDGLTDFGADAIGTDDRLAQFHRVENTYLSTFQTLGGLGLLLGTVGLSAVLLRNVLERRRELALLGAVGFGPDRLFFVVIAESALLLACGLAAGAASALIAIAPAALARGAALPGGRGLWVMLAGVFITGLLSSAVATKAAMQSRLLEALRTD
ncbi:MAG: FtsX-like permease family protein, partial [Vicinamibacterales bacterium]